MGLYETQSGLSYSTDSDKKREKVEMINQLLMGIHTAVAAEAMGLASTIGLDTRQVYDIIITAAGNSRMFEDRVPRMADIDSFPKRTLNASLQWISIATSSARAQGFPFPLSCAAEQLYIQASSQGLGSRDDSSITRIYIPSTPTTIHEKAGTGPDQPLSAGQVSPSKTKLHKIGFVGLGAMGIGMASSLARAGFEVCGYDVYQPSVEKFHALSHKCARANSPAEAASDADIFILMVQNADQAKDVLFGSGKAADALPRSSVVILSSTVPPASVRTFGEQLRQFGKDLELVDAPVSGGVTRAAQGRLTIISSGSEQALVKANPSLVAMSGVPKNLYRINGGVGAASSVKLINQLLAGVHLAVAAEVMAFGAKLGLETRKLYEVIKTSDGASWMFENRVPAMVNSDWTPHSQLAIFVKDLGIVLDEARRLSYPVPLAAAAHQLYLMGASHGWSQDADGGVVRVWESMTGCRVYQGDSS